MVKNHNHSPESIPTAGESAYAAIDRILTQAGLDLEQVPVSCAIIFADIWNAANDSKLKKACERIAGLEAQATRYEKMIGESVCINFENQTWVSKTRAGWGGWKPAGSTGLAGYPVTEFTATSLEAYEALVKESND